MEFIGRGWRREWLATHSASEINPSLEVGDATEHRWHDAFSFVASEVYLGHPLASWPEQAKLKEIMGTCNVILEKFLQNIGQQVSKGMRMCLAVPAWKAPNGRTYHLPSLDHLEKMGYNRVSFEHATQAELVYARPGQIVARELLVITRN